MEKKYKYNFDEEVDRRGTYSLKWDVALKELPMWVADMDFKTAPQIREALLKRMNNGVFGYTIIPKEWYEAYISWWKRKHDFEIKEEWLVFCTGVVPAISSAVRKLTTAAENVVVLTPTYNIFFNSIYNNGRYILECPLVYDGEGYSIDFEDLEKKLALAQTTLFILCNPQNPVGKIWDVETLKRIGNLCKKYHVTVVSDEIHCDLTAPGREYTPFAKASETCRDISVTCVAPTKAFNIAGLQSAAIFVPNEALRNKMNRALNTDEVAEPNAFAVDAAIAAFNESEDWLGELKEYIQDNKEYVADFIKKHNLNLKIVSMEVTYLLWIDISAYSNNSESFTKLLREKTGLYICEGSEYGGDGGHFIRINVACQRAKVEDGMNRLCMFLEKK